MTINRRLMAVLGVAAMVSMGVGRSWGNPVSLGDSGLSLGAGGQDDPFYSFSFSGEDISGNGWLNANGGSGVFTAYEGDGTIFTDTITLYPVPVSGPGVPNSPSNYFQYDDLLYPATNQLVDYHGLLFMTGAHLEVNIYSIGPDSYIYYDNTGFNKSISFILTEVAVPLPASVGVGFSMLAGFGALFGMRKRLSRRARIA